MYSNPLLLVSWLLGTLLEMAIFWVVFRAHKQREWMSVLVFCAASILVSALSLGTMQHQATRLVILWTWAYVGAVMRLWIYRAVLASFHGIDFISKTLRTSVVVVAAVLAFAAALLSIHSDQPRVLAASIYAQRSIHFAFAALFITTLCAARLLNWTRIAVGITAGLGLQIGSSVLTSWLITSGSRAIRHAAINAASLSFLLSLTIWLYTFVKARETSRLPICSPEDVDFA